MQFRAGVLYIVLFSVIAAGAYAVVATADTPEATIDEGDADHTLSVDENFTLNDRTYTLTEIGETEEGGDHGGGHTVVTGTLQYVNESGALEAEWEDGGEVYLEENGTAYTVAINQPDENGEAENDSEGGEDGSDSEDGGDGEDGGNESEDAGNESSEDEGDAGPTSFTLREDFDEDEHETVEREDGIYVVVEENGTERLVHIDEYDEIESRTYETGDDVEFYYNDSESQVEATVAEITAETVTVEWRGETTTEYELRQGQTVTLEDQELVAYFPNTEEVHLSSDVESFEQQEQDAEAFQERLTGLWWVITMSVITVILLAALAFMPVRG